uniref:Chaperonin 10 n=1 Tax=Prorocentrum micans TaxID=2945 RepID=A0A7S2TB47_PROMC|mmetsp:Transcript_1479/g.1167  ORF Transcript_1479/g.1167 Transcript_1479/m.1167 type:complete len:104 (+) Transcript_1479:415-726(+)
MSAAAFKRFVPLADRILVQKLKADVKSAGGILLPDSAKQDVNQAKVLAVGPGRRNPKGDIVPMSTKAGDTVVIPRYGGTELKLEEEEYHIYRDEDIVGIIKDE